MATKNKIQFTPIASATIRQVRISPQKLRLIVDLIRGKQVEPALQILKYSPTKGAKIAHKLLSSAIANARENAGADVDKLWVMRGTVDTAKTLKRYMPRAHGRADMLSKRSSHMTLTLGAK